MPELENSYSHPFNYENDSWELANQSSLKAYVMIVFKYFEDICYHFHVKPCKSVQRPTQSTRGDNKTKDLSPSPSRV